MASSWTRDKRRAEATAKSYAECREGREAVEEAFRDSPFKQAALEVYDYQRRRMEQEEADREARRDYELEAAIDACETFDDVKDALRLIAERIAR